MSDYSATLKEVKHHVDVGRQKKEELKGRECIGMLKMLYTLN